jgi:hypothetical protein
MKITRRAMTAVLASLGAQAQTPAGPVAAVQPAPTTDAELQSAREQVRANLTALSQFEVPVSTEPAFEFKV